MVVCLAGRATMDDGRKNVISRISARRMLEHGFLAGKMDGNTNMKHRNFAIGNM
jgi:hypothetical protein